MGESRGAVAPIVGALLLCVSMAACGSSNAGDSDPEGSASAAPELASETPSEVSSPVATAPETPDVAVPEAVEPGEPVEVDGREVLPPVDLADAVAPSSDGVTIWLEDFTALEQAGGRPGEVGGPAIQFDVLVHNDGEEPIDLATLVVTVAYGADRTPAEDVIGEESLPLVGTVEPGTTVRGTMVFVVPPEERSNVLVSVDLAADARVTVFEGDVPQ